MAKHPANLYDLLNHGVPITPVYWRYPEYETFEAAHKDGAIRNGEEIYGYTQLMDTFANVRAALDLMDSSASALVRVRITVPDAKSPQTLDLSLDHT